MRTLHLTTPLTRGDDVIHAQHTLADNALHQNYQPGRLDGIYGPETMRAAKRAKFWCGYPPSQIDGAYGAKLDELLHGKPLPVDFHVRRDARLKAKPAVPLRTLALNEARKHIGVKEHPAGSNRVMFSDWYGAVGPWCAMFATYVYTKAGSKAFKRGSRYAFVPFIVHDARAGLNHLALTMRPEPGDLVCFDWPGESPGVADHVGLFEAWTHGGGLSVLEGNTSSDEHGSQSNGGMVARRARSRSEVQVFVRVTR